MKHKYIYISLAILMSACSGVSKSEQNDSNAAEETASEQLVSGTTAEVDTTAIYRSEDLNKFGLRGPVKSVRTTDYASFVTCLSETLNFNEQGELTTQFNNFIDNVTSCNGNGVIDMTSCRESDGTTFNLEFTNFDVLGNPISGTYKSDGPDGMWSATFTITYDKFDRESNWLTRTFKGETVSQIINDEGNYGREERDNLTVTESRVITYYR